MTVRIPYHATAPSRLESLTVSMLTSAGLPRPHLPGPRVAGVLTMTPSATLSPAGRLSMASVLLPRPVAPRGAPATPRRAAPVGRQDMFLAAEWSARQEVRFREALAHLRLCRDAVSDLELAAPRPPPPEAAPAPSLLADPADAERDNRRLERDWTARSRDRLAAHETAKLRHEDLLREATGRLRAAEAALSAVQDDFAKGPLTALPDPPPEAGDSPFIPPVLDVAEELEADRLDDMAAALRGTSLGHTIPRPVYASLSRQVVDDATTRVFLLEALAVFTKLEVAYPLIQEALAAKTGAPSLDVLARRRESLPEAALIDLAVGQTYQKLAFDILSLSAAKEGAGGPKRASAARSLGSNFDYMGARCIRAGDCAVELSEAEKAVGYLPLLHIALCVWYAEHAYSPEDSVGGFLAAAKKLSFTKAGTFDPKEDMDFLVLAKQKAASARERFDPDLVYRAILRAVSKIQSPDTRLARVPPGRAHPRGLRWDQYAEDLMDEDARRAQLLEGDSREHTYTSLELDTLVDNLFDLASACANQRAAAALTRTGQGVFRVEVMEEEAEEAAAAVARARADSPVHLTPREVMDALHGPEVQGPPPLGPLVTPRSLAPPRPASPPRVHWAPSASPPSPGVVPRPAPGGAPPSSARWTRGHKLNPPRPAAVQEGSTGTPSDPPPSGSATSAGTASSPPVDAAAALLASARAALTADSPLVPFLPKIKDAGGRIPVWNRERRRVHALPLRVRRALSPQDTLLWDVFVHAAYLHYGPRDDGGSTHATSSAALTPTPESPAPDTYAPDPSATLLTVARASLSADSPLVEFLPHIKNAGGRFPMWDPEARLVHPLPARVQRALSASDSLLWGVFVHAAHRHHAGPAPPPAAVSPPLGSVRRQGARAVPPPPAGPPPQAAPEPSAASVLITAGVPSALGPVGGAEPRSVSTGPLPATERYGVLGTPICGALEAHVVPGDHSILSTGRLGELGVLLVTGGPAPYILVGSRSIPLRLGHAQDTWGDLVADPRLPEGTYTFRDPAEPTHADLPSTPVLMDSGAQVSVVAPGDAHLVTGYIQSRTIVGVGGHATHPTRSGYVVLDFPFDMAGAARIGRVVFQEPGEPPSPARVRRVAVTPPRVAVVGDPPPWQEAPEALQAPVSVSTLPRRPSAFPPLRRAVDVAARFNIFGPDRLKQFPGVVLGVIPYSVDSTRDYSNGEAAIASRRMTPTSPLLNGLSMAIREALPPGHTWWSDVSNKHQPDFEGHRYTRLFADERTTYAKAFFSASKDSSTLLTQLEELERWVTMHVPGGCFKALRCDFASEAVKQGHGDSILVAAFTQFCATRPGFRVIPIAPQSQAFNKVESTWGRVNGHAFVNVRRARLGVQAWSLAHRGAVFQHNHTPPASQRPGVSQT